MSAGRLHRRPSVGENRSENGDHLAIAVVGFGQLAPRKIARRNTYRLSLGPKSLLTLRDAGHIFGGISGYDAKEASDENLALVPQVQRLTWAHLRSTLYPDDPAWEEFCGVLTSGRVGRVESK